MIIGYIYKTTDLKNGKIYIGQHKGSVFDTNYNGSGNIIKSIKRKRPQDLETKVIEWCSTKTELDEREKYWISSFGSQDPKIGYNLAEGGNTNLGYKHTDEWKRKMSESMKGRKNPHTEEWKQKVSCSLKGHEIPQNVREKISKTQTGKVMSEESKRKMSEAQKGKSRGKGIPKPKYKWLTPTGEIRVMAASNVGHHHPDWIKIND